MRSVEDGEEEGRKVEDGLRRVGDGRSYVEEVGGRLRVA